MKRLLFLPLLLIAVSAWAVPPSPPVSLVGVESKVATATVATLPAAGTAGTLRQVTDGADATDCTVGGGATVVLCQDTGVAWTVVAASGSGDLKADGTVPLSADWDVGAFEVRAETFESDVATGTAPLVVASTTKVTNLNADAIDDTSPGAMGLTILATADEATFKSAVNLEAGTDFYGSTDNAVHSTLNLTGANTLGLGTASTNTGLISLKNDTNANAFTLQSGVSTEAMTLTLPTAMPTANSAVFSGNTDGTTAWTVNPAVSTINVYGTGVTAGTGSATTGTFVLKNSTNNNTFTIQPGVTGANISWTLPTAAPGGADYLLNVDADGTMGYTDPSSLGGGSVADEVFSAANFDGDTTTGVSQDDFYDRFNLFDADDDGDFTDEAWFPSATGAPTDATYLTTTAEAGLSAESNLGALTTGLLKITVDGGVATPSTAEAGDIPDLSATYEGLLTDSSGLAGALDDETGTGAAVFGIAPTIQGKVNRTGTAVDDDDCTGEQGSWWWDSTDSAFEFCNANSGTPEVLGDITAVGDCATGACTADAVLDDENISPTGGTWDLGALTLTLPALGNGATSAGYMTLFEDSDNGTDSISVYGPAALAGNISITFPNDDGGILQTEDTTATFTNKTIDSASNTIDVTLAEVNGGTAGASAFDFGGATSLEIPNKNADPAVAGEVLLDTTVTNFTGGAVRYYNGSAIKQLVDMTAATAEACTDDQVVAYDADADLWYCKDDATAAGGEGDSITIDGTAVDTTAAFASTGDIDFIIADGGAGGPDTVTANINDDSITKSMFADEDWGDVSVSSNSITLDADVVGTNEMADADHGQVAWSSGVATVQGIAVRTASKSANYTIGTDDTDEAYGGVIYVTSAATITAPAVAAGMSFTVITIGAVAVSLDVNASDRMYLDGVALDDGDKATNTSTTGDLIHCTYESAAGWYCASGSPDGDSWTDGGA